jgi:hypothetical protein
MFVLASSVSPPCFGDLATADHGCGCAVDVASTLQVHVDATGAHRSRQRGMVTSVTV